MRRIIACMPIVLFALTGACGTAGPSPDAPVGQIILVGVESFSVEQVERMMAEGELPNLTKVWNQGARAMISCPDPLQSPMLWTTALTGKNADKHGVVGEYVYHTNGSVMMPPSGMRSVPNVFQMVGNRGKLVAEIGFPGSFPAEVVNGFNLAYGALPSRSTEAAEHTFHLDQPGLGAAYPESLYQRVLSLYTPVEKLSREDTSDFFILNETEFGMLYDKPMGSIYQHENPLRDFGLTLQRDRAQFALLASLDEEFKPLLSGIHTELCASLESAYWPAAWTDHFNIPADGKRRFHDTVPAAYRWLDQRIGELLESLPPDGTLCIVGDRGFGNGSSTVLDSDADPVPLPIVTNRTMLLLYGHGIQTGAVLKEANLVDLTPTLLSLLDLPVGADMDGRTLTRLFDPEFAAAHTHRSIETWNTEFDLSARYPSQLKQKAFEEASGATKDAVNSTENAPEAPR